MMGKRFGLLFRSAVVLLFVTLSLGSWVSPLARGAEIDNIKIARPSLSMNFMQPLLARKAGIDRQEGISADVVQMQTPVAIAALIAGDADYTLAFESSVNAVYVTTARSKTSTSRRSLTAGASRPVLWRLFHSTASGISRS